MSMGHLGKNWLFVEFLIMAILTDMRWYLTVETEFQIQFNLN